MHSSQNARLVMFPAFLLCCACGAGENRQPSLTDSDTLTDGGAADRSPVNDGLTLDVEPFDGGALDGMAADMRVIEDRCDCEDLGPCLILPPVCLPNTCKYLPLDSDGDGHPPEICAEFVADSDDCDDTDSTIYPGAPELCDGADNDCDDAVDEDATPPCK